MRTGKNKPLFMNDLAKAALNALGPLSDLRQHVKKLVRESVDNIADELDLVSRHEFDRVEAMLVKARQRQEELERRLAALEKGKPTATAKKATAPKKSVKGKKK